MDELHTGGVAVEALLLTPGSIQPEPFDPAAYLSAPRAAPLPYTAGPTVELVQTFDPAAYLGDAAKRGPMTIGDIKPIVATIGGVEMVTVPAAHYADLLNSVSVFQGIEVKLLDPTPDVEGALGLITRLHVEGVLSEGQVAQATALDRVEIRRRALDYEDMQAEQAGTETETAALGEGVAGKVAEEHGSAPDRPKRRSRR